MKNKFLGIVCIIYASIIIYVWELDLLKNFLAPNMQIYIKLSIIPLLIMGLIIIFNPKLKYRFKITDLFLLLPIIMLVLANDAKLGEKLSSNRTGFNREKASTKENIEVNNEIEEIDFNNPYFDIDDDMYMELANYISYTPNAIKFVGKTIRVRGFVQKYASFIPDGYFVVGKYAITCCAADSEYIGFFVKYDTSKIRSYNWYQIEGVLKQGKDKDGYNILYIDVVNIEELSDNEEQYIYPCFSNNSCSKLDKYDLEY